MKWTFVGCRKLTSITIGDSVTSIEVLAFRQCNTLSAVTFLGDAPKVAKDALEGSSTANPKRRAGVRLGAAGR